MKERALLQCATLIISVGKPHKFHQCFFFAICYCYYLNQIEFFHVINKFSQSWYHNFALKIAKESKVYFIFAYITSNIDFEHSREMSKSRGFSMIFQKFRRPIDLICYQKPSGTLIEKHYLILRWHFKLHVMKYCIIFSSSSSFIWRNVLRGHAGLCRLTRHLVVCCEIVQDVPWNHPNVAF